MADLLLNWAVMLASLGVLFYVAWVGFRDLQGSAAPRVVSRPQAWPEDDFGMAESGELVPQSVPQMDGERYLSVTYERGGQVARVQAIPEGEPAYIGTEQLPSMGNGVLVRHLRVTHGPDGFTLENRHSSQPVSWSEEGGRSGELQPGELLPVRDTVHLALGDARVSCREEIPHKVSR